MNTIMMSQSNLDEIDFMSDSLSMFGDVNNTARDDGIVRYGSLVLNIPPKASKLPHTRELIYLGWTSMLTEC